MDNEEYLSVVNENLDLKHENYMLKGQIRNQNIGAFFITALMTIAIISLLVKDC
jgi:hypothetical protein